MTEWYYAEGKQRQGPFSAQEMGDYFKNKTINAKTLIWQDGFIQWVPLSQVMDELGLTPPDREDEAVKPMPDLPMESDTSLVSSISGDGDNADIPLDGQQTVPDEQAKVVYAGFWRRAAAYLVDQYLLFLFIVPFHLMWVGRYFGEQISLGDVGIMILSYVPFAIYSCICHVFFNGATIGKKFIGIKVVHVGGGRLTFARGLVRSVTFIFSCLLWYVGCLMAAFTDQKRAMHDIICDTVVVDRWAYTDQPNLQQNGVGRRAIIVFAMSIIISVICLAIFVMLLVQSFSGRSWFY